LEKEHMKRYYADVTSYYNTPYIIVANSEEEARNKLHYYLSEPYSEEIAKDISEGEMDYIDTDIDPTQWNIEEDTENYEEELINGDA
jgi:hypothetical protein